MTDNTHKKEHIWQVINQIPSGKVASYGQVATLAGLPRAARLVGHTLNRLPAGSKIPWHRVINSQGKISLPLGSDQYLEQRRRLTEEGITFTKNKISFAKHGWKP
jgi:methylated-DNA-protein-cysteine methyltransferase-like protein